MPFQKRHKRGRRPAYLPTPDEIRAECDKIQAEWSDDERERRSCTKARGWQPPQVADLWMSVEDD